MNELRLAVSVTRLAGAAAVRGEAVAGGYTWAGRCRVGLADGGSVFVKACVDEPTAGWLRDEYRVYAAVTGRFMPEVRGWEDDGERPVLLLEDLGGAHWPPWKAGQVERLL